MLKNGVIVVRVETVIGKQEVLQGGIYHFDNKPLIVKEWSPKLEFTKEELETIPIWIKFPELDFKYWSKSVLSKLGSMIGKPLMVDHKTEERNGLKFARLLVEVELGAHLPDEVQFKNKKGKVVVQAVQYDWKPLLCNFRKRYGYEENECRIKKKVPKPINVAGVVTKGPAQQDPPHEVKNDNQDRVLTNQMTKKNLQQGREVASASIDSWQTPRKLSKTPYSVAVGQVCQATSVNSFQVLQHSAELHVTT
ncbi:hypothetical protein P3S67_019046 [Capsicum chacoense]